MPNDDLKFECPVCRRVDGQVKAGLRDGVQRYRCNHCNHRYSPQPRHRGIAAEIRRQAVDLHAAGVSNREIGRRLGLNPRNISNWVRGAGSRERDNVFDSIDAGSNSAASPRRLPTVASGRTVRRATIHDVAELAGVSPSSVSNYLNDKGRMGETTRESIRTAISRLQFTPNSLVRAIRERKTNILGVVTFGLNDLGDYRRQPIVVDVLGGINRAASTRGYNVLLYTALQADRTATAGTIFLDGKIDGLIWVGPANDEERHVYAARAGLPVMALFARQEFEGVGYVDVDNIDAIEQVVGHLVAQGHRRIAYAGSTFNQPFADRLQGYRTGLETAGIKWDSKLVATDRAIAKCWIPSGVTDGYAAAVDRWLSMAGPPTAIVLTTDEWAAWVIDYLGKRGIRVPDDIAVTGFDNTAQVLDPATRLTSVAQDFSEIGRLGGAGIIDMIDGKYSYKDCRKLLPGKLILRESSDKPLDSPPD